MSEPTGTAKLCECGCGQPTRVAKQNDLRHGHVKGQGVRFLKGHSHRGKLVSAETRARLSAAVSGYKQGGWKGDQASYRALHGYLCNHYPKSGICDECGKPAARTEYALIHGRTYSRSRDDYREMCRPCHMTYDLKGKRLSLSADQVTEVRRLRGLGRSRPSLASEFGVGLSTIDNVLAGRGGYAHAA